MCLFLRTFYSPSHNYLKATRALLIISTVSRQDSTGRENTLNLVARTLKVLSINRLTFECLCYKLTTHVSNSKKGKASKDCVSLGKHQTQQKYKGTKAHFQSKSKQELLGFGKMK